jgi:non-canonical purine NTP pyrophosphatase (RdgB/HAM1 family)
MRLEEMIFATGNANKAHEIESMLGLEVHQLMVDLPEIQAVAVDEVISAKARAAYAVVGRAVLVEDTGLSVHAWKGLPGALVRWFLATVGNEGICRMVDNFDDRSATAVTCLGFFDGQDVHVFRGEMRGTIADDPRGTGGFGWDPIFIPEGWGKTFAEGTQDEKSAISMRRLSVEQLKAWLSEETPEG